DAAHVASLLERLGGRAGERGTARQWLVVHEAVDRAAPQPFDDGPRLAVPVHELADGRLDVEGVDVERVRSGFRVDAEPGPLAPDAVPRCLVAHPRHDAVRGLYALEPVAYGARDLGLATPGALLLTGEPDLAR